MQVAGIKRYAPRTLYGRATLILLLPVVVIQVVVSIVFIQRLFEDVSEQMTHNAAYELQFLVDRVAAAPDAAAARAELSRLGAAFEVETALPDPEPVAQDSRMPWDLSGSRVIPTLRDELAGVTGIDLARIGNRVDMTVATPHGPLGLFFDRDRVSAQNPHQLLVIMLLTALMMTVIAYLFLKNQLRPIARLSDAATAFGRGRIVPYRPAGATEVRAAGAAFLDMRQRIERQIEQRTLMLSGVSHDLRTPLTRLRLEMSMLDPDEAAPMLRDLDEMQAMIDAFLDFARDGALGEAVETDPAALLDTAIADARRAGLPVTRGRVAGAGTAVLQPLAVRRALDNLIANGARHGDRVEVSLDQSDRALVFSVEDDGPGIPAEARDAAMRPFSRLDPARNQDRGGGVGLGLAIARDVARQHGGALRLEDGTRLGGLRVDLVLAR